MSNSVHMLENRKRSKTKLLIVLLLTAGYMVLEIIGGFLSNSLALLADAGHMLADVGALLISFFAFVIASKPPNPKATYGYYRAEIIGALFNGLILLVIAFFIIKEAILRIFNPEPIAYQTMMGIAVGGLIINLLGLLILHKDKGQNLNVRGAWLHVMSDTLGSVGVVLSGLMIMLFDLQIADPIASLIISLLIGFSSIKLIIETLNVLMEHTPPHIDPAEVSEEILSFNEALKVHDLHIWSITSGKEALSVHIVAQKDADYDKLLKDVQIMLQRKFNIDHSTIQIENVCKGKKNC